MKCEWVDYIVVYVDLFEVKCVGYVNVYEIGQDVFKCFDVGEFDVVMIIYNCFQLVVSQILIVQQIIFVVFEESEGVNVDYDYELSEEVILVDMLFVSILIQIFVVLLENVVFEQGVCMSVMDNVICNVGEMIDKLIIEFNCLCQVVIISELIEIILGVEVF